LAGIGGERLTTGHVSSAFRQAANDIGLDQPRRIIANTVFGRPIVHSLRHSFAINTLKRIREEGRSPQAALPILAAYMGHRKYRYTALYLKVIDAEQRQELVDFAFSHQEDI
jgi:integrase